jgi:hypothetical protein
VFSLSPPTNHRTSTLHERHAAHSTQETSGGRYDFVHFDKNGCLELIVFSIVLVNSSLLGRNICCFHDFIGKFYKTERKVNPGIIRD